MTDESERVLWCGNLSDRATESLLYELFLQAGPLDNVKIPRDNEQRQRSFAFITFQHACSVDYAVRIFNGTKLFNRQLTLSRKSGSNSSPKVNFNSGSSQHSSNYGEGPNSQHGQQMLQTTAVLNNLIASLNLPQQLNADMLAQMNQQIMQGFGTDYHDSEQSTLQTKHNHSDRYKQKQTPYSRDSRNNDNYHRHDRKDGREDHHQHRSRNSNDRSKDYRRRR